MKPFPEVPRASQWSSLLERCLPIAIEGRIRAIRGTTILASGLPTPVGALVRITRRQGEPLDAEVIGFDGLTTILSPLSPLEGVSAGDSARLYRTIRTVPTGIELIGRVLDASGNPIDDGDPIALAARVPCDAIPIAALDRPPIEKRISTSVRAIDAFLTLDMDNESVSSPGPGLARVHCWGCWLAALRPMW